MSGPHAVSLQEHPEIHMVLHTVHFFARLTTPCSGTQALLRRNNKEAA